MKRLLPGQTPAATPAAATKSAPIRTTRPVGTTPRQRRSPWQSAVPVCVALLFGLAVLLAGQRAPAQEMVGCSADGTGCGGAPVFNTSIPGCLMGALCRPWFPHASFYIDYRLRRFGEAHTTYEFGYPEAGYPSPLSQLKFPLNSTWHGLELGLEDPRWAVRAEWMTPTSDRVDGRFEDRDWQLPGPAGDDFTDLGITKLRWMDAHVVDTSLEVMLWDGPLGLPLSVWPVGGFRWQKFDMMAFDGAQVEYFDGYYDYIPVPEYAIDGDALRFRQEFYQYYLGGQLHLVLPDGELLPEIRLTFQGDWAYTEGFNYDHHLLREGFRLTKEYTYGHAWHAGLTAEVFFTDYVTVGVEVDYLDILTSGTHRWINEPYGIDESWSRGVHVFSEQTSAAVCVRLRFRRGAAPTWSRRFAAAPTPPRQRSADLPATCRAPSGPRLPVLPAPTARRGRRLSPTG